MNFIKLFALLVTFYLFQSKAQCQSCVMDNNDEQFGSYTISFNNLANVSFSRTNLGFSEIELDFFALQRKRIIHFIGYHRFETNKEYEKHVKIGQAEKSRLLNIANLLDSISTCPNLDYSMVRGGSWSTLKIEGHKTSCHLDIMLDDKENPCVKQALVILNELNSLFNIESCYNLFLKT